MDKYRIDDDKIASLKEIYESMEFGEASDTMIQPEVVKRPVAPPKDAPKEMQNKYVADLKKWYDYNATQPAAPAKVATPTDKMVKKPSPGTASDEEPSNGVKLNVDALLNDGQGNYWVTKYDQVLFLYRSPTDTEAGEPILHPDARQFRNADKIFIYRRFIKPSTGELTTKGEEFLKSHDPAKFDLIMDNFLDKTFADKTGDIPDNTLSRSVAVLDPDEPLREEIKQGEQDRRLG